MIIQKDHPDYDMEIYMIKGETGKVYIIHDRPFKMGAPSWLEYDLETGYINFIMDDGNIRDFGIAIDTDFAPDIKNYNDITMALVKNSIYVDGAKYPLIIHGGHE